MFKETHRWNISSYCLQLTSITFSCFIPSAHLSPLINFCNKIWSNCIWAMLLQNSAFPSHKGRLLYINLVDIKVTFNDAPMKPSIKVSQEIYETRIAWFVSKYLRFNAHPIRTAWHHFDQEEMPIEAPRETFAAKRPPTEPARPLVARSSPLARSLVLRPSVPR